MHGTDARETKNFQIQENLFKFNFDCRDNQTAMVGIKCEK